MRVTNRWASKDQF